MACRTCRTYLPVLSFMCAASNNVVAFAAYITCRKQRSLISVCHCSKMIPSAAQPDAETITARPQSAELQSKVADNDAGHCRTRLRGTFSCLFPSIMLHFLKAMSARRRHGEIGCNVSWVSANRALSVICSIDPRSKKHTVNARVLVLKGLFSNFYTAAFTVCGFR